ncbi:MAG: hypothetical protein HYT13_02550 [Candidatus Liptonbacteria bacterium]|nr:hypothetical protein [Candidatus Liptonbacteria bacterium]
MVGSPQRQNLIEQITTERISRPSGFYRGIFLDIFTVASALGVGFFYKIYLAKQVALWVPLLSLGLFSIFSTLEIYLIKSWGRRFFIILLEVAALVGFFYDQSLKLVIIIAALTLFFLLWGEASSRGQVENLMEIRFFKTARTQLNKVVTAVAIIGVFLYLPHSNAEDILFSPASFDKFFDWAAGAASSFYPKFRFTSSFGDLASDIARSQLAKNADFSKITPAERAKAIEDASDKIIKDLGRTLKITIAPTEKTSKVFYNLIVNNLEELKNKFGNRFLIVWGIVLFIAVRGVGSIFAWFAALFSFFFYQMLLGFNVVRVIGESRTHEVLEF